jgi:cytochrome c oxidase subunit 2
MDDKMVSGERPFRDKLATARSAVNMMTTRKSRAVRALMTAHRLLWAVCLLGATACSVAGERQPPLPAASELFQLCQQCHGDAALGNRAVNAPSIAGLPQWYIDSQLKKFKSGGRGTHFDDITGMQMRPMAMSLHNDEEIKTIAAYVSSLPASKPAPVLTSGDPNRGKTLYAPCTACHQVDGAGNEALKAPPLTHANDWYLETSLKKFKAGIRGTNPLDQTGALMRPMSQTLVDDQAVADVVAYITTLQK